MAKGKSPLTKSLTLATGEALDLSGIYAMELFGPNATYSEPMTLEQAARESEIYAEILFGIEDGMPVMFKGEPGVGKSAIIRDTCEKLGIPYVVINAPNRAPEDSVAVFPHKEQQPDGTYKYVLDRKLDAALTSETPFVLIVEEIARSADQVQNQLLELIQERKLADKPINALAIFACDNISKADGIKAGLDGTLSDRFTTIKVGSNDLPWRHALASKYSGVNLKRAFEVVNGVVDPVLRYNLSNRTLDHILWNLLAGNPGEWGLGIRGQRNYLFDSKGRDHTEEIIGKLAEAIGVRQPERVLDPFQRAIRQACEQRVNAYIEGPPGIGKTSYLRAYLEDNGYDALVLSGPVMQPENMIVPIPDGEQISLVLMDWFQNPAKAGTKGKVLVIDEIWRAPEVVRQRLLEILQEHTLGGQPIPDLLSVIALNNPRDFAGGSLKVALPDRAQSDRFHISIQITAQHVPWRDFLLRKFGEIAEPFVEWWSEVITDEMRQVVTARTIQRMIKRHAKGLPLQKALMWIDDPLGDSTYVPVPLDELSRMLADKPLMYLAKVAEDADFYEEKLSADKDCVEGITVLTAFSKAELAMLEKHRDAVVRISRHMSRQMWVSLMRATPERQSFWLEVLQEGKGSKS